MRLVNQAPALEVQYFVDSPFCEYSPVQDVNGDRNEVFAVKAYDPTYITQQQNDNINIRTYTGLPPNVIQTNAQVTIPYWNNPTNIINDSPNPPYGPAPAGGGNGINAAPGAGFDGTARLQQGKIHVAQCVGVNLDANTATTGFRIYQIDPFSVTVDCIKLFQSATNLWYTYPSMAIDASGNFFVTYTYNNPLSAGVMYFKSDSQQTSCQETAAGNGGWSSDRWGKF